MPSMLFAIVPSPVHLKDRIRTRCWSRLWKWRNLMKHFFFFYDRGPRTEHVGAVFYVSAGRNTSKGTEALNDKPSHAWLPQLATLIRTLLKIRHEESRKTNACWCWGGACRNTLQWLIGAQLRSGEWGGWVRRRERKGDVGGECRRRVILAWVSVEDSTPEHNPHPLVQTHSYLQESQPILKHAASFQQQPTTAVTKRE